MKASFTCKLHNLTKFSVTPCKYCLKVACIGIVIVKLNFSCCNTVLDVLLLFMKNRDCILRFPLKRCERFWYKRGCRNGYTHRLALWLFGTFVICINYRLTKAGNCGYIIHCFGRQTNHKIKFYRSPAACKSSCASLQKFIFTNIFIDNITHTLTACLRSKGKSALAYGFNLIHNVIGKAVNTQ